MDDYQKALDYISKSICTFLALRSLQDIQGAKNLHILQEAVDKANKYDEKETPKKPIERLFESKKHFKVCPNCWEKDIKTFVFGKYCDECGQRLE